MVIVFIGMDNHSECPLHILVLAGVEQAEVEQAEAHRRSDRAFLAMDCFV